MKEKYVVNYEDDNSKIKKETLNVIDINWNKIKKEKNLYFYINFKDINYKNYNYIIKKLKRIKFKSIKKDFNIGYKDNDNIIICNVYNYDNNNEYHKNFIYAINAIYKENTMQMYNYIYDVVCEYLDNQFIEKNLCNFKNDRCGEKENSDVKVGCCRHYKNRKTGIFNLKNELVVCEYLENKRCSAKCISCKLFTCNYLRKKGIRFKIKEIFLLDVFFNPIQKLIIKSSVFTKKEEIIKKLISLK